MGYARDVKRLRGLFTRRNDGWGARSGMASAATLASLLSNGRLTTKACRLPMAAAEAGATVLPGTGSKESVDHLHLKRAACEWMWSEGAIDAVEEARGYDGRFDAYSPSADWIVEVGNSSMEKLIFAIRDPDHPRFTLIPYQATRYSDGRLRRPIAVELIWGVDLTDELDAEMRRDDREAMDRRDRDRRERMIAEAQARKVARLP